MTAQEILAAWRNAAKTGDFYAVFEAVTGFKETEVRERFSQWVALTHDAAEEIAAENGVSIREGGFQAFLADVKRSPVLRGCAYFGYSDDPNPRANRPWPESEDCASCGSRAGAQYVHKFTCAIYGAG